jgi:hypothetical protein
VDNEVQRLIDPRARVHNKLVSYVDELVSQDDESIHQESPSWNLAPNTIMGHLFLCKGAFTPNVKSMLIKNLGGILGGTQC